MVEMSHISLRAWKLVFEYCGLGPCIGESVCMCVLVLIKKMCALCVCVCVGDLKGMSLRARNTAIGQREKE